MEKRVALKNDYIHVKRDGSGALTYGGDQGFFEKRIHHLPHAKKKQKFGCGVVAFGDLLLYLGKKDPKFQILQNQQYLEAVSKIKEGEYIRYFDRIYRLLGGIWINGITSAQLVFHFNRLALKYHWRLIAIWGLSRRKLFDRMEKMIGRDLPVILCIPVLIFPRKKEDGLWLYEREESAKGQPVYQKRARVRAHFVMVTGFIRDGEETWYEVSSWGKQYYFNRKEYDTLIHTHLLGNYLGNILYIQGKC